MNQKIIEIKNLHKYFGNEENLIHVLKELNFTIDRSDFVAIIGQSGSGKTTLMNILGCLDTPTSGSYLIDGVEASALDADGLADLRGRKLGFIFQRYNLLTSMNALNNVALPAVYAGLSHDERNRRASGLLDGLGLGDKLANRPHQLSGGQQQRVSIARALMNGGEIILADEPTGALDSKSGETVMEILKSLHNDGHTVILVTHDHTIAAQASRVIEIKDGEIISDIRRDEARQAGYKKHEASYSGSLSQFKDQFAEAFKMSLQAIVAHKLRSALTMLGIIIGIASVVLMVALGRGSQEQIMSDISSMGTNTINVYPGTGFGDMRSGRVKTLTVSDSEILSKQSYLASSTPVASTSGVLVYKNISLNAQLSGVGEQYFDVKGLKIDVGRLLTGQDILENASVVVIDPNTRNMLFPGGENPLGKVIIFKKQPLLVIGITQKQDSVFGPTDNLNMWSPYTTVMSKLTGDPHIQSIIVKVKDEVNPQAAERSLTKLLTVKHGGRTDFFTMNTDSVRKTVESATQTTTFLISGIALISLLVGGIGVMNIMLVSVTERTAEIGVRMAIGARRFNILEQFLIEAVLICLIGGLVGVGISYALGLIFNHFSNSLSMSFSTASVILAIGCSSLIGVVFGFVPARNASRLNPIEALARD